MARPAYGALLVEQAHKQLRVSFAVYRRNLRQTPKRPHYPAVRQQDVILEYPDVRRSRVVAPSQRVYVVVHALLRIYARLFQKPEVVFLRISCIVSVHVVNSLVNPILMLAIAEIRVGLTDQYSNVQIGSFFGSESFKKTRNCSETKLSELTIDS